MKHLFALLVTLVPISSLAGIAQGYLYDQGIGSDPSVVFTEQFEESSTSAMVSGGGWTDVKHQEQIFLVTDSFEGGAGKSGEFRHIGGSVSGSHVFRQLPQNSQLYVRWYVKYDGSSTYHHAGTWMGGYNPPTSYPQGDAGIAPTGADLFSVGVEPRDFTPRIDYYVYWKDMHCAGGCFGNSFIQNNAYQVNPSRWIEMEALIGMNTPTTGTTGVLALWIDGVQVSNLGPGYPTGTWSGDTFTPGAGPAFPGFQWRTATNLALNWLWLEDYSPEEASNHTGWVRFDHVVVATSYIGPLSKPSTQCPQTQ